MGSAGARTLTLEIVPQTAADVLGEQRRLLDAVRCAFDPNALMLASRLAAELRAADRAAPIAAEGLAFELLAVLARRKLRDEGGRMPLWLQTVRDLVHDSVPHAVSIVDAARGVGLHPVHVARVFHTRLGDSFGAYQRVLRVRWAAQVIAGSDEPLARIAARAGFSDQSHLTRVFKRVVGTTPWQYRRRRGAEPERR